MTLLSFASMYILMYAMVDSRRSVYANINQVYMAGPMTAPNHSGAILMCREAEISDPTIQDLCRGIIGSQRLEIEEMKALLSRP
jgi:uncharacterized protein (DUF305 family)